MLAVPVTLRGREGVVAGLPVHVTVVFATPQEFNAAWDETEAPSEADLWYTRLGARPRAFQVHTALQRDRVGGLPVAYYSAVYLRVDYGLLVCPRRLLAHELAHSAGLHHPGPFVESIMDAVSRGCPMRSAPMPLRWVDHEGLLPVADHVLVQYARLLTGVDAPTPPRPRGSGVHAGEPADGPVLLGLK